MSHGQSVSAKSRVVAADDRLMKHPESDDFRTRDGGAKALRGDRGGRGKRDGASWLLAREIDGAQRSGRATKLVRVGRFLGHEQDDGTNVFEEQQQTLLLMLLTYRTAGGEGDITWRKNGMDVDDDKVTKIDETSSKLIIENAALEDSGTYTCHCDFENGHVDSIETELHIYMGPWFGQTKTYHEFLEGTEGRVPCLVTGQPEVDVLWLRDQKPVSSEVPPTVYLKEEEKKVLASPETNVSLLCLVDGIPKPNITWNVPTTIDSSHHQFNSDRSQLIIKSVTKSDYGEYTCTAINKIAESSATMKLHVFEALGVFVSAEQQIVSVGERVSVSCNVSGHPEPELHWINKHNGRRVDATSGHAYVSEGVLVIEDMVPSDGGLYSCMAVGAIGNASRDVAIYNPLVITNLKQYTSYTVRLAASNAVGVGHFSENKPVRTMGIREPDVPILSPIGMKVEGNTFYIPLQHVEQGASPLQHFTLRYREDKDGAEWKEMELSPSADSISLQDLSFGSDYEVEVKAVNFNGSSIPATFNFTIGQQPLKLKGISTPRGSLQMAGVKKEAGELTEVTCDKVSLTKHEYVQSRPSAHACI
ncbi:unnamed protein product [Tetraodon nigroviridis]|uniref:(spotted green pufferfish) hypothetical protein n=1 Tax=Tetraodon nigroviridis TaxID=99883 RepID=Q4RFF0_TETNG|nr:unnamed protein product [Tetraodon nigroviridis]